MNTRPILFSAPMVRAILAGTKTQTRRIVKPQPPHSTWYKINGAQSHACCGADAQSIGDQSIGDLVFWVPPTPRSKDHLLPCPYGSPGSHLYVKESWAIVPKPVGASEICRIGPDGSGATYKEAWTDPSAYKWKSPLFMPRWASRITLELTDVRIERLHAITEEDARAEGVLNYGESLVVQHDDPSLPWARPRFQALWDVINGERAPWASNPWVWVLGFKRVEMGA
jgi:hypothetical protein